MNKKKQELNTSVKLIYKDGSEKVYDTIEDASLESGLSVNSIKLRCNKSRQGGSNKKDKITCSWIDDYTYRYYNAKQSKRKGNNFELDIIKELTELGYKGLVSSRSQNKRLDAAKIDIAETEDKLPFYIQCKALAVTPNIETITKGCNVTDRPLVIFWRKQNSEMKEHDYVIMPKSVLYNLIKK